MKIVGVNGSPRTGRCTSALVGAVLRGAKDAGAETTLLDLGTMKIQGCVACQRCKRAHRCVVKDDMQEFYDLAPESDVLVLGSPIYLDHVTAQMMAFIQRMYCYIGSGLENCYPRPGVKAVVGITYGAGDPKLYDGVLDWMEGRLKYYFEIPTADKLKVPESHAARLDESHSEIRKAYELGKRLGQGG